MKRYKKMAMVIALLTIGLLVGCTSGNNEISNNTSSPVVTEIQSEIPEETKIESSMIEEESENTDTKEEISSDEQVNDELEEPADVENSSIEVESESQVKHEYHWILNTSTKKVHTEKCSSVSDIKDKNKTESDLSPEELKEKGYTACGKCKPF